ncbi:hypothetical protein [Luteolibacter sp. LG18]|uniref:hypothetical protein n=1 Tax=Luteolibacter sp. LG18 TaxID=2819286 RepID=UPI002B2AB730|nr:hypothetical protein llg_38620 [Luteolibacter sp. LG18]
MPVDIQTLEPAVRDPKKLRRTAWILVAIMILGGIMVLSAYVLKNKADQKKALSEDHSRPAIISRIDKGRDLRVLRQDNHQAGLLDLGGKVWLACAVSSSDPAISARSVEVMKRLAERYKATEDVAFVTLVIDPGPAEDLHGLLVTESGKLGATLPQWWVASTEPQTLYKFIKNEFKTSLFPHQEDGKWKYDTSIVVVDRNRHVRNAVIPQKRGGEAYVARFDFDQAAEWDARGVKTGTDQTNAQTLEGVLVKTIEQLREEPLKD